MQIFRPLSHTINPSVKQGILPDCLKTGEIISISSKVLACPEIITGPFLCLLLLATYMKNPYLKLYFPIEDNSY